MSTPIPHSHATPSTPVDITFGSYSPAETDEQGESAEWAQEVLPTEEHLVATHVDHHIPHGWHDFGALGWAGATLMVLVLSLLVWGLVLPAIGLRESWNAMPLR